MKKIKIKNVYLVSTPTKILKWNLQYTSRETHHGEVHLSITSSETFTHIIRKKKLWERVWFLHLVTIHPTQGSRRVWFLHLHLLIFTISLSFTKNLNVWDKRKGDCWLYIVHDDYPNLLRCLSWVGILSWGDGLNLYVFMNANLCT